ncbi:hypothetical protein BDF14DRAFT_1868470 [Spinellus fusiger]|nr:hypothetical protein BDF14DRAFT_1868470 [Spinellus fusiger]
MDQYSSHSTSSTVTWYTPRYVELPHDYQIPAETLSTEAEYQIQREGGCLAAIYINERHIPPSPTEWSATSPVDPNAFVPIIPLTDCYMSADEVDYV